ncbi:hypothetical protein F4678DRAFT_486875 [Xylaria arbuscula]|nr:hypothetical protein F4678DRAFT_486875 [Xylaria arbuscula]
MAEPHFPQFNKLPINLRCRVWDIFAFPPGPMLHVLFPEKDYEHCRVTIYSTKAKGTSHVADMATTCALMQVNQEARKHVLSGRQPFYVEDRIYDLRVLFHSAHESRNLEGSWEKRSFYNFFFVNWDIDMFCFRGGRIQYQLHNMFEEDILAKIKHIAIEFGGLIGLGDKDNTISALSYNQLSKEPTPKPLDMICSHLPSLKTIFLALNHSTVYRLCHYVLFHDRDWPEDVDSDDPDYDESLERPDWQLEAEKEVTGWITSLPEYKFGYHRVEPEKRCYSLQLLQYPSGRHHSLPYAKTDFGKWVDEFVSFAKEDATEAYAREHGRVVYAEDDLEGFKARGGKVEEVDLVEVQMVMDHYGAFDEKLGGYYRKRNPPVCTSGSSFSRLDG